MVMLYKNSRKCVLCKDCFKVELFLVWVFVFLCVNVMFRNIGIIVDELFVL